MPHTHTPAQQRAGGAELTDLRVDVGLGAPPVIVVSGEIDIQSASQLREELLRVIHRHGSQLALDLGGVTFIDCAGINVLLATRRRAQLEGGWVRVVQASPCARRIISLLDLQQAFTLPAPESWARR
jgi:anti-anti-sigma factor